MLNYQRVLRMSRVLWQNSASLSVFESEDVAGLQHIGCNAEYVGASRFHPYIIHRSSANKNMGSVQKNDDHPIPRYPRDLNKKPQKTTRNHSSRLPCVLQSTVTRGCGGAWKGMNHAAWNYLMSNHVRFSYLFCFLSMCVDVCICLLFHSSSSSSSFSSSLLKKLVVGAS